MAMQTAHARFGPDGRQVVTVVVDRGYHPDTIVARAGVPLRLIFRLDDRDSCSERVVFSSPHVDRRLAPTGLTTIDLPAQAPGEVRFTCAMGRYRGRIELTAERSPSILTRLRRRVPRLGTPVGTALLFWICVVLLLALLAVPAVDASVLIGAGAALITWVAGFRWAVGRAAEPT